MVFLGSKQTEKEINFSILKELFYRDICIPCLENKNYHNVKFQRNSNIPDKSIGLLKTDDLSTVHCAITCDEFEYAEIVYYHKEETTDCNGETTTCYIETFNGIKLFIPYNTKITSRVRIIPSRTIFGIEKMYSAMGDKKKENEQLIDIEDIEFNEKFEVFSEDEHSAYYFLTSSIIEKIKKIRQKNIISIVIDQNGMYVAVDKKYRLFELPEKLVKNMEADSITPNSYESDAKKLEELFNEFYVLLKKD